MREHAALSAWMEGGVCGAAGKIRLTGRAESRIIETGGDVQHMARPAVQIKEEIGNAADTITD